MLYSDGFITFEVIPEYFSCLIYSFLFLFDKKITGNMKDIKEPVGYSLLMGAFPVC